MVQGIVFSLPGVAPNNVAPGLSVNRCDFRGWKISWLSETEQSLHLNFLWPSLTENLVLMVAKANPIFSNEVGKTNKKERGKALERNAVRR